MGVKERRLREKQGLRQEILDAARELFVKQGYETVSMRKIAERIEYSPTTIYLHFRDKNELFDHLCEEAFGKLLQKLQSLGTGVTDPVESLRRGLCAYVEFGLEHPDHYQITFMTRRDRPNEPERAAQPQNCGCESFESLKNSVEACVQAGRFRVKDVDLVSQSLWAGVHGITSLLIVHPDFPWVDRTTLISSTIDAILEGLRA
jgi:AcrR family transcriptional regulator